MRGVCSRALLSPCECLYASCGVVRRPRRRPLARYFCCASSESTPTISFTFATNLPAGGRTFPPTHTHTLSQTHSHTHGFFNSFIFIFFFSFFFACDVTLACLRSLADYYYAAGRARLPPSLLCLSFSPSFSLSFLFIAPTTRACAPLPPYLKKKRLHPRLEIYKPIFGMLRMPYASCSDTAARWVIGAEVHGRAGGAAGPGAQV